MRNSKDNRPVIYSAVFGGYDVAPFLPSEDQLEKYRFILFSDTLKDIAGWELVNISSDNSILSNRRIKMFPWEYFSSRHSFYIDGHVSLGTKFQELFSYLLEGSDVFAVQQHRAGGDIGSELIRCIDNRKLSRKQLQNIFNSGIDFNHTSVECGFIYRDSMSESVRKHANKWWELFNNVCQRDQLWIAQAGLDSNLLITILDCCFNDNNQYLNVGIHKNARLKNLCSRTIKATQVMKTGLIL